jgi:hypothetical protein
VNGERPLSRGPVPSAAQQLEHPDDDDDPATEPRSADEVFELRKAYNRNGYRPVPVYSRQKRPRGNNWLADAMRDPPLWATRQPEDVALSTGLATGNIAAADVDIRLQGVVDRMVWEIEQVVGPTPLLRIGLAPKTLLGFRCENPFKKLSTDTFIMPDGSEAKVEFLADGQQFVADGIHPDTGLPYVWPNGSPETVPLVDVPAITLAQAQDIIDRARALIIANGGILKQKPRPERPPLKGSDPDRDSFFGAVNEAALHSLTAWVKAVFPRAVYQQGTGAWRVASKDRGRPDLEEDISLHVDGIQDFGLERGLTPIDVVIAHGGAGDAVAAAHWLCERLGIDPASLGWHPGPTRATLRSENQDRRPPEQQRTPTPDREPSPGPRPQLWPEPVDCFAGPDTLPPQLTEDEVPQAIWPFVADTARRMGVATSSVALGAIVSLSSAVSDEWRLQPKRRDYLWTENARLWGAIVGPPSILKTPIIRACTHPLEHMEMQAHKAWELEMERYLQEQAAAKEAGDKKRPGPPPRRERRVVESITIEAFQEVLRSDAKAALNAPARKVLCRQDELGEFLANFDRYSNGRAGGDRGAYLRLYNGGAFSVDRIGRGSFITANWSACILGGIQPEPIQRIARDAVDDGLLQRFIYDVQTSPAQAGADASPDTAAFHRYTKLFPALAALHPPPGDDHPHSVHLHADAHVHREAIDALARGMAAMPDASPRLQSAFGKWPGLFARICLTFHLIDVADARAVGDLGPSVNAVPAATAERVARYMRRILLPHLQRAEDLMFATVQTGHAKWIAGHILAHGLDRITVRDIVQNYRALRPPEVRPFLDSTMASLASIAWIDPVQPRNALGPVVAWRVNPLVHERFAERAQQERTDRPQRAQEVRDAIAARQN